MIKPLADRLRPTNFDEVAAQQFLRPLVVSLLINMLKDTLLIDIMVDVKI